MSEPHIVINGVTLSEGQAMALRVAASNFLSEMQLPGALGTDPQGIGLAAGYSLTIRSILNLMWQPQHKSDCATNNAPALPVGECDCGAEKREGEG